MIGRHVSLLHRMASFAGLLVFFLALPTAAAADVKTLDLLPQADAKASADAREAFRRGDIVRIVGGKPEDLQRLLGIGGVVLNGRQTVGSGSSNAPVPLEPQLVAARATRTGALHQFVQLAPRGVNAGNPGVMSGFERWAEKERRLAQ